MRKTSLQAYKELCDSGKADNQRTRVLLMILNKPGMTRAQISKTMNLPINAVCGRVKELLDQTAIEEGERVDCPITGNSAFQLRPIEGEEEQMRFPI